MDIEPEHTILELCTSLLLFYYGKNNFICITAWIGVNKRFTSRGQCSISNSSLYPNTMLIYCWTKNVVLMNCFLGTVGYAIPANHGLPPWVWSCFLKTTWVAWAKGWYSMLGIVLGRGRKKGRLDAW